ncbi:MAG: hypothetical protein GXP53_02765 [Deltaproteobacteria bacterium]|nr:hypothetical protein [Deltaproteobacteria bacterium]
MTTNIIAGIRDRFSKKSSDELLLIWTTNDRRRWSNETFDVVEDILVTRGVRLPPQGIAGAARNLDRSKGANLLIFWLLTFSVLFCGVIGYRFYNAGLFYFAFLCAVIPSTMVCFAYHMKFMAILLIVVFLIVTLFAFFPPLQDGLLLLITAIMRLKHGAA